MMPFIYLEKYDLNCYDIGSLYVRIYRYHKTGSFYPYILFSGEDYVSSDGNYHLTFDDAYTHTFG